MSRSRDFQRHLKQLLWDEARRREPPPEVESEDAEQAGLDTWVLLYDAEAIDELDPNEPPLSLFCALAAFIVREHRGWDPSPRTVVSAEETIEAFHAAPGERPGLASTTCLLNGIFAESLNRYIGDGVNEYEPAFREFCLAYAS